MDQRATGVRFRICDEDKEIILPLLYAEKNRIEREIQHKQSRIETSQRIAFRLTAIYSDRKLERINKLINRLEQI